MRESLAGYADYRRRLQHYHQKQHQQQHSGVAAPPPSARPESYPHHPPSLPLLQLRVRVRSPGLLLLHRRGGGGGAKAAQAPGRRRGGIGTDPSPLPHATICGGRDGEARRFRHGFGPHVAQDAPAAADAGSLYLRLQRYDDNDGGGGLRLPRERTAPTASTAKKGTGTISPIPSSAFPSTPRNRGGSRRLFCRLRPPKRRRQPRRWR